jgi:hypothetical protein
MTDVPEVPALLALPSSAPAGELEVVGGRGSSRRPGWWLSVRWLLPALVHRPRKASL